MLATRLGNDTTTKKTDNQKNEILTLKSTRNKVSVGEKQVNESRYFR